MDSPKRKPNRLQNFDYSTPGAYFITVCTKDRKCIFWDAVRVSNAHSAIFQLSQSGQIVANAICNIHNHYPAVSVDHYIVMPNHIHLLLQINTDCNGRPMVAPTISRVIQQFKGIVTKQIGYSVWQKLFHDHVIRDKADYLKIWEYIDTNPVRWKEDCFFEE